MNNFHYFVQHAKYSGLPELVDQIHIYALAHGLKITREVIPVSQLEKYKSYPVIKFVKDANERIEAADLIKHDKGQLCLFRVDTIERVAPFEATFASEYSDLDLFADLTNRFTRSHTFTSMTRRTIDVHSIIHRHFKEDSTSVIIREADYPKGIHPQWAKVTSEGVIFSISYGHESSCRDRHDGMKSLSQEIEVQSLEKFRPQIDAMFDAAIKEHGDLISRDAFERDQIPVHTRIKRRNPYHGGEDAVDPVEDLSPPVPAYVLADPAKPKRRTFCEAVRDYLAS